MNKDIPNRFYRISVKALILNETKNKFLIIKQECGVWDMPGGGLDWGENVKDALSREITEEMGLKIKLMSGNPSYFITTMGPNKDIWIANVFYEVQLEDLNFKPSEECIDFRFVSVDELKDYNVLDNVLEFSKVFLTE